MNHREEHKRNIADLTSLLGADALKMQAFARRLRFLYLAELERGLTPRQHAYEESVLLRADKLAEQHGLCVRVQRDPRSWPLYLYDPSYPLLFKDQSSIEGIAVCPC